MCSCGVIVLQILLYEAFLSAHESTPASRTVSFHASLWLQNAAASLKFCCGILPPYFDYVVHANHKNPFISAITFFFKNPPQLLLLLCWSNSETTWRGSFYVIFVHHFVGLSWRLIDIVFLELRAVRSTDCCWFNVITYVLEHPGFPWIEPHAEETVWAALMERLKHC